jgi:hypothetical protein
MNMRAVSLIVEEWNDVFIQRTNEHAARAKMRSGAKRAPHPGYNKEA